MARKPHTHLARTLRRQLTKEERLLWRHLRGRRLDFKFRRQVPIEGYIVDFASFETKVVIELDGSQHAEAIHRQSDARRDAALERLGFKVLRFWNHEIHDSLDDVLNHIYETCADR